MDENPLKKPFDLTAFRRPQPRGPSPEELAEALGPFSPPDDYDFGEEFEPGVPRPIPRQNWRGSYASRRRSQPMILIVLGIALAVFRMLPSIQNLGYYILPLWYLHWVGALFFIGGIGQLIRNLCAWDDFKYIRDGIPVAGRVIHQQRGEIPQFLNGTMIGTICTIQALVEYINPQRQEREFVDVQTDTFPLAKADRYESGLEVGDTVTLVGLPGDFATNLRLYAWTGLDPEQDWPKFDGKPLRGMTPLKALLITKSVLLGLWLVVGLLHMILYFPEDWSWKWGGGFGAAGVLLVFVGLGWVAVRQENAKQIATVAPTNRKEMIFGGIGLSFVGILGGLFAMCLVNSLLDRNPPVPRSVEIVNSWETTHNFLLRHYEVELRPLRGGADFKKGISITNLTQLQEVGSRYGVELVRPGWLGLHWVEGIRSVEWRLASEPPTEAEKSRIIRFKNLQTGEVFALVPYIRVNEKANEKLSVPPPPELVPLAAQDLAQQSQMEVVK